ncbi:MULTISPECIES: histidine phosphatase family protein [unclassified Shewanella]|uniref:histidine phosphatase family protein n=1 Tax=unclassified Shewanella TaxID=196818 RepID=UPI0021DB27E0|nr:MULTISPECIES: histidine phosphatase family protein [unclassified Shewanella]MCU7988039.1 histidine phosphatase family protein [Shewanella sp. SW24]MCU8060521.1 histidine phosphatase family protein [Shewanella sp. SM55]MCU8071780.1 histidine phosphatase family protein [Shewanella sp. SM32]
MKQVRLLLLRHGECEGGAILRGRVDVPLSKKGWQQMSAAVESQASVCSAIYSSISRRCADFAHAFAAELHSTAALISESRPLQAQCLSGLQEIDFGDWDGCRLDELYQQEGERLAAYWQNPWQTPLPNGETMASFESRVNGTIDQILAAEFERLTLDSHKMGNENSAVNETADNMPATQVWVVTHGGVIRHLMARALGVERAVGFYSQLDLPVAAVVSINVLQDEQGVCYWRLDWPSGRRC